MLLRKQRRNESLLLRNQISRSCTTRRSIAIPVSSSKASYLRYTECFTARRKQGGSQSTNDKAKGNAKSAGATLRRYGEQALKEDIQNLLLEWAEDVELSERIWLRASSSSRKTFWDYENAPIVKGDTRLRGYPFPTRRPVSFVSFGIRS